MKGSYATDMEKTAEASIAAGRIQEAIDQCDKLASYYRDQESNCDEAGEYADGMRNSRYADEWIKRAIELRQKLSP